MSSNSQIWVTSDWHAFHNKPFVYEARGFTSPEEMNQEIIKKHNSVVDYEDEVYFLGDGFLTCSNELGCSFIQQLKGKIHWIIGNHCTDNKLKAISECCNVVDIAFAARLKYEGMNFYLSHYPTLTANPGKDKPIFNLHGHTHSKDRFELFDKGCYNVAMDAHHCDVVPLDLIVRDIQNKRKEEKEME